MIPIGTKVRIIYPEKDNEREGIITSTEIDEADWKWYWVDFGHVSYTVPIENLMVID